MHALIANLRIAAATMSICVVGYTLAVLGFASAASPSSAEGALLRAEDGTVVGSRLIAQRFERPHYFWPRPSAVGYDAARAGGSNKSPASADLIAHARSVVGRHRASAATPLPADLVAASGSGLDPDISEEAALYQVDRVAQARQVPPAQLAATVRKLARSPGGPFTSRRVVNVLELNLAIDREVPEP